MNKTANIKQYRKAYWQAGKTDKVRAAKRAAYREKNKKRLYLYMRAYYTKNRTKLSKKNAEYRLNNLGRYRKWGKAWRLNNPERIMAIRNRSRINHQPLTANSVKIALRVVEQLKLGIIRKRDKKQIIKLLENSKVLKLNKKHK